MGPGDLTPTNIVLNDFAGNPSDTKGCVHVDLMIGSKTLLTLSLSLKEKGHIACCLEEIGSMQTAAFHLLCINNLFNWWMMM
jgi:hypothetical protein